ncbi:hypothetical protein GCM10010168_28680 [Actinoplanes ianthinogenes]|uniref:Novel STAND NTPase 1 domain-containing protein n=1 Tax=Actinoplanes ianthinogenes TaxID=122358 RepID=A0ABM7LL69_9ACTN|nr:helix-turn-helix domain-containing protein [Actinoplanes ianthinogenes]BCJ40010.1 hypothetical protein Aiant_06670 [Actinoplanes ianthinogenes]GGR09650.1 hypothetical protein GCM10010168_28680 [Actinoplanes ianthinogenes]
MIDPAEISTRQDFAAGLTRLREEAGRTVRDVARDAKLEPGTAGGYFAGRHLPPPGRPEVLRRLLGACGVIDEETLDCWADALVRVRVSPGRRPANAPVPYRGLAGFTAGDAEWFFGREALTARLLDEVDTCRRDGGGWIVVVGPSGSGKSSLIQAGAVAARPGLLVVDQLEQHLDDAAFLDGIPDGVVVMGLRADFYGRALRVPRLAGALQEHQIVVGPMDTGDVRRAIVEPARRARLDVEDGLVALLLRDYAGSLPLLSHALRATWENSRRGRLTVAAYQATGGVHDAVARSAEEVYHDLGDDQREAARHLFLRLVHADDDVRRKVPRAELPPDEVAERFVAARLLTAGDDHLEIAHEALIEAWPRLRGWVDTDRDGRRVHRRITEAAARWAEADHDPDLLLRGASLTAAGSARLRLNDLERSFVTASRERAEAEQVALRKRTRRMQRLAVLLAVLALTASALAVVAYRQQRAAATERDRAVSRQIAVESEQLRVTDPGLGLQLAVAGYRTARTPEALSGLLSAFSAAPESRLAGPKGVMQAAAISPDEHVVAGAGADNAVHLWTDGRPGTPLAGHTGTIFGLAFSPDGRLLASAGADRTVRLWDLPTRTLKAVLNGPANTVYAIAFSPDGRRIAAGSADHTVQVWDLTKPRERPMVLRSGDYVQAVAFSPDGRTIAAGSKDRTVRLWDEHGGPIGRPLTGPAKTVFAVAFSPDGHTLAAGSADKTVWLWRVDDRKVTAVPSLTGPTGWVNGVTFDPAGRTVAAASSDGKTWLWDLTTHQPVSVLAHPAPVTAVSFARGTGRLVTSAADGAARIWDLPGPVLGGATQGVFNAIFGGTRLAVTSIDDSVRLWDTTDPRRARALGPALPHAVGPGLQPSGAGTLSPDGGTLAVGAMDGTVRLWDVRDPARPVLVPARLRRQRDVIQALSFSADGRLLAAASNDRTGALWDVSDPYHPRDGGLLTGPANYAYSPTFRPDGRVFAMAGADGVVRLWDIADIRRPVALGKPLTAGSSYVFSLGFSPDGRLLAAGATDDAVHLWDVSDPSRPVPVGVPLTGPHNYVYSVAVSGDGRMVAAGGGDGQIWLWSIADPRRPVHYATLTGHAGAVYTVEFDPRRPVLVSGGADGYARMWLLDPAEVIRQACAGAGDPMTEQEWHRYVPGRAYLKPC